MEIERRAPEDIRGVERDGEEVTPARHNGSVRDKGETALSGGAPGPK